MKYIYSVSACVFLAEEHGSNFEPLPDLLPHPCNIDSLSEDFEIASFLENRAMNKNPFSNFHTQPVYV